MPDLLSTLKSLSVPKDIKLLQEAKKKEIWKHIDSFNSVLQAKKSYGNYPGEAGFDDYLKAVDKALREKRKGKTAYLSRDTISKNLRIMSSIDYTPPDDEKGLIEHLFALLLHYNLDPVFPPSVSDLYLDFAMTKIIEKVQSLVIIHSLSGKDMLRTKKSTKTKKQSMNNFLRKYMDMKDQRGPSWEKLPASRRAEFVIREMNKKDAPGVSTACKYIKKGKELEII